MVGLTLVNCVKLLFMSPNSVHITEYENYGGYDRSSKLIRDSEVGQGCSEKGRI